jgi:streptomycin 6-kinase
VRLQVQPLLSTTQTSFDSPGILTDTLKLQPHPQETLQQTEEIEADKSQQIPVAKCQSVFEKNILSRHQKEGEIWLANLPEEIKKITALWELSELKPFDNLTQNYVLEGFQKTTHIVLKLSIDTRCLKKEAEVLDAFAGNGAISVLNRREGALLLQKAVPGNRLKTHFPKEKEKPIAIACEVIKKLHQAPLPKEGNYKHIKDLLSILDKEWEIPKGLLFKARNLKNQLLETTTTPVLLHGDLHQDNILLNDENWIVIDPVGIIGFPINEVWACVEDPKYDLEYIAKYFDYKFEDVVKWYYVHLIATACSQVKNNLDPKFFLDLARSVRSLNPELNDCEE